jgi:hypothetical protein
MYAAAISAWGNYAARFHHHSSGSGGPGLSKIQALWNEMNRAYPLIVSSNDEDKNSTNGKYGSVEDEEDSIHFEKNGDDEEEEDNHEEQDGHSLPAYNAIIHALAQTRQPGAGHMAHDILNQLLQNYQQNPNTSRLKPNQKTFSAVISAYGRTGRCCFSFAF